MNMKIENAIPKAVRIFHMEHLIVLKQVHSIRIRMHARGCTCTLVHSIINLHTLIDLVSYLHEIYLNRAVKL